jgi:hypothetical protein
LSKTSQQPPETPAPPPARFQISLATLLMIVMATALLASAVRCTGMPPEFQLVAFVACGMFVAYATWRWAAAWRSLEQWNRIQQHRAALERWLRERKNALSQQNEPGDGDSAVN